MKAPIVSIPRRWPAALLSCMVVFLTSLLIVACGSGGGDATPAAIAPPPDDKPALDAFMLQGTITPPYHSAVDSDVNDPNATYTSNDTPEQAQNVHNPVILAGYVNLPGQGASGRSFAIGDPDDFYRVSLSSGDSIILSISSPNGTDLDLYLYRAQGFTLVDASLGTGADETLDAPGNGDFIVGVRIYNEGEAITGASIYNLIIGSAADLSNSTGIRLSHDFVPGEIVVRFSENATLPSRKTFSVDEPLMFGMTPIGGTGEREMLLSFDAGGQTRSVFSTLNLKAPMTGKASITTVSNRHQHKLDTLKVLKSIKNRSDVSVAEPNLIRRAFKVPDDDFFNLQWHYDKIHLPEAWEVTTGNDDVIVAVVDTGVLLNHPDLGGRLTSDGYDFISSEMVEGNESEGEQGSIDPNPDDPGDQATGGSSFHGTHVAGTIAADTDNAMGVAGVGWGSTRIMPVRALGVGGGTSYDILQAVRYAAGLSNDSATLPNRRADIINLSLGGGGYSTIEQDLFRSISESGVIVIAAAGNEASTKPSYPAAYDGVISVSAVDYSSTIAYYSNFGETIDVAAPGGDNTADLNSDGYPDGVVSTMGDDTSGTIEMSYSFNQGTSMAVPHVAGVAALMKAAWPDLGYHAFENLLQSGAITNDLGDPGRDNLYGYGLIDAEKAVLAAQGGTLPTMLSASPSMLGFGLTLSMGTLGLDQQGDADTLLTVNSISDDADWLFVYAGQVDDNGLGVYTVEVDRTGLTDGFYNAAITVVSSANTVSVPVSMQIRQIDRTVDAGYHYVLLLNPATQENLKQVEATLEDGVYHFSFADVGQGDYLLYAGTDLDNDFVVGNTGEALGAYLSTDQPIEIQVDQDVSDLDFRTEFNINLFDTNTLNHLSRYFPIRSTPKKEIERLQ